MTWITDGFQVGRVIGLGMCPAQLGGLDLADDVVDHAGQGDAAGALAALALAFMRSITWLRTLTQALS
jgi:hypothetical protein